MRNSDKNSMLLGDNLRIQEIMDDNETAENVSHTAATTKAMKR